MSIVTNEQVLAELVQRHQALYCGPAIESRLDALIREGSHSRLPRQEIVRILRDSRSVFFDTHVEVVSGHHTATYLRFESLAGIPALVQVVAEHMAEWMRHAFGQDPVSGIVAPASAAAKLATAIADRLRGTMPLRLTVTSYCCETGQIGTDIQIGAINPGERFVVLNDVTTRGQCVSKLATVVASHGGILAGMMVFARRDSGQFPLVNQLAARYPFYCAADLHMPQWEAAHCPLCRTHKPLLSWRGIPELQ
jgi:orotate phosphoribosyltransferase